MCTVVIDERVSRVVEVHHHHHHPVKNVLYFLKECVAAVEALNQSNILSGTMEQKNGWGWGGWGVDRFLVMKV